MNRGTVAALCAVVALSTAACGSKQTSFRRAGSQGATTSQSAPASTTPAGPRFDPPLQFAETRGIEIPAGLVLAETGVGYSFSSKEDEATVVAIDLSTGQPRWSSPIGTTKEASAEDVTLTGWPAQVSVNDRDLVVAAFQVRIKGTGVDADRFEVRSVAVDAADGRQVWASTVRTWAEVDTRSDATTRLVGAGSAGVVITTEARDQPDITDAVDPGTGQKRWSAEDFLAVDVDGDTVVGMKSSSGKETFIPSGRAASDGKELWVAPTLVRPDSTSYGAQSMSDPGPGVTTVMGRPGRYGALRTDLLDPATGKPKLTHPGTYNCQHDRQSVLVCSADYWYGGPASLSVEAYDSTSMRTLWSISKDTPGKHIPTVRDVYHGALYALANGSTVLDARTGEARETSLSIEPSRVTTGFAVAGQRVYPATK